MPATSRLRCACGLFVCLFLLACAPPALVRNVRLQTYAALGLLAQSELATELRLPSLIAPGSPALDPGVLEAQLAAELVDPWWKDADYRAQLYLSAIRVATRYRALFRNAPPAFGPALPPTYVKEAEQLTAPHSALRVRLDHAYALFCFANLKYGTAQERLRSALTAAAGLTDQPLLQALLADAQATIAQIMGSSDRAASLRPQLANGPAAKAGRVSLLAPIPAYLHHRPRPFGEWYEYLQLLLSVMAQAAEQKHVGEVEQAWTLAWPIIEQRIPEPLQYVGIFRAAQLLAKAGLGDRALTLLHRWPAHRQLESKQDSLSVAEATAWHCALGGVYLEMGSPGDAIEHLAYCKAHRSIPDLTLEQDLARSYERQGDFVRAAGFYKESRDRFETIRHNLQEDPESLAGLATFFNGSFLPSYHALLRLPLRGGPVSDPVVVEQLIAAAEAVRARQLRDLLKLSHGKGSDEAVPVHLAALRRHLGPDEVVLSYVATEETLVLICLTSKTATAQALPIKRKKLEEQVNKLAVQLATPTLQEGNLLLEKGLQELSKTILPPSLYDDAIADKTRLIVVPDEVLTGVPFDLLSRPGSDYRPLFAEQELLLVPSMTLFLDAEPEPNRPLRVLALADPPIPTELSPGVPRLPEARDEVRGALYGQPLAEADCAESGHCVRLDEAASKDFLLAGNLSSYTVLHAATHGFLNGYEKYGLYEPALLLSAPSDRPLLDHFLLASQVHGLRMQTDLVILSACHSGQGPSAVGEGVLGLGRAFLQHSRAVLMTLWAVDSLAAEQLIIQFYQQLNQDDLSPRQLAHALTLAKREYVKEQQSPAGRLCTGLKLRSSVVFPSGPATAARPVLCSHPFFFAPFVLLAR